MQNAKVNSLHIVDPVFTIMQTKGLLNMLLYGISCCFDNNCAFVGNNIVKEFFFLQRNEF